MEKGNIKSVTNLMKNYARMERVIAENLRVKVGHSTTVGTYREKIWLSLFEQIVPKKFTIEQSVFIIDSNGNISNEVDLVIFDEQYTPYIFRTENLKYIPIEAVAVVVECKSTKLDSEKLKRWSDSIDHLTTSLNSIVRLQTDVLISNMDKLTEEKKSVQTSTRPIKILCHIAASDNKNIREMFDIVLRGEKRKLSMHLCGEKKLSEWYKELNHHNVPEDKKDCIKEYSGKEKENPSINDFVIREKRGEEHATENTILSLIFVLNQLLMLINNPIFFPHCSYVKLFNDVGEEK